MRIYGIHWHAPKLEKDSHHVCHDSAVAIISSEGKLDFYGSLERYTRIKKDASNGWRIFDYFPALRPQKNDLIVSVNNGLGTGSGLCVDHHIAHACAAWMFRPDDNPRTFLSYDGYGRGCDGNLHHSLVGKISESGIEGEIYDSIPSSAPLGKVLGIFNVGKLMGLAGSLPNAPKISDVDFVCANLLNEKQMEQAAGFYRHHIDLIWNALSKHLDGPVVIGGGTALALELNTRIHKQVGDVVFGPPTDDSGIALGAAAYGYFSITNRWPESLKTPFIVETQEPLPKKGPQLPKEVARMLYEGGVVGLLRGKAECGPRALGHRSLLATPSCEMKIKVSEELKGREFYRPVAPIITDRQFDWFFDGPQGKYMQYAVNCKEDAIKHAPAIVHCDGTSRPQVVTSDDPWLYELLIEYGKLSGSECLINTSLNRNKPICNSFQDAYDDFGDRISYVSIL